MRLPIDLRRVFRFLKEGGPLPFKTGPTQQTPAQRPAESYAQHHALQKAFAIPAIASQISANREDRAKKVPLFLIALASLECTCHPCL